MEPPGVEPGSKQAISMLSTRLFCDWLSGAAPDTNTLWPRLLPGLIAGRRSGLPVGLFPFLWYPYTRRHRTGATEGHPASRSLSGRWPLILHSGKIRQQERSYFRRLLFRRSRFTGSTPCARRAYISTGLAVKAMPTPLYAKSKDSVFYVMFQPVITYHSVKKNLHRNIHRPPTKRTTSSKQSNYAHFKQTASHFHPHLKNYPYPLPYTQKGIRILSGISKHTQSIRQ